MYRLPKERRTPETYARSRLAATGEDSRGSVPTNRLEYEDVFNRAEVMLQPHQLQNIKIQQQRQQQSVQYTPQMQHGFQNSQFGDNPKQFPPMQNRNVPNQHPYQQQQFTNHSQQTNAQIRYASQSGYTQKSTPVARPHSADFLDFERRHPLDYNTNDNTELLNNESVGFRPHYNSTTPNRYARHRIQGGNVPNNPQPPRPKSSFEHRAPKIGLDASGYYDDQNDVAIELANYDWSEEGYADKMRTTSVNGNGPGNNNDLQTRSRSQSRASQAQNYGGMDAKVDHGETKNMLTTATGGSGNNQNNIMHQYPPNHTQNTSHRQTDALRVN